MRGFLKRKSLLRGLEDNPHARRAGLLFSTIILLTTLLPVLLRAEDGQQDTLKEAPAAANSTNSSQFVGSDTCKTCHEPEAASFEHGPHWRTAKNKSPELQGCEGCHGAGKAHVESGGDVSKIISFTKLNGRAASETCLTCHANTAKHGNFKRSPHFANDVGCTSCHSVHAPEVRTALLKQPQPTLCYACHAEVKPDFSKPSHHRVNEGLIKCSDCHDPHGTNLPHQLRATGFQQSTCVGCHSDKIGPFLYEHPPVKVEGCVSCHTPHGSANPHLLTRSNVNQMCLECHTMTATSIAANIPTFHNQATKYQSCTLCHVAIHGSNTDPVFFKR